MRKMKLMRMGTGASNKVGPLVQNKPWSFSAKVGDIVEVDERQYAHLIHHYEEGMWKELVPAASGKQKVSYETKGSGSGS